MCDDALSGQEAEAAYIIITDALRNRIIGSVNCPVGYTKADEIEGYVVDKLMEISKQEDIFRQIVEQVNLEAESDRSPYEDELNEVNSRIS